ncbi:MAG TPA: glycoside hydrolase family 38 C-terminal domain-containing protein [Caulobacteraceae bacterium]
MGRDGEPSAASDIGAPVRRARGRYPTYTRERLAQFGARLKRAIYPQRVAVERIEICGPTDRIPFEEGITLPYREAALGEVLGPLFATYWVRVTARVPEGWAGHRADLYWDSRSEGLLWLDGRSHQGLNPGRHTAILFTEAGVGEVVTFHIEVACNGTFGRGDAAERSGPDPYRLIACELRRFDPQAWSLFHDFDILRQLEADREPAQTLRSTGGVGAKIVRPALDNTWAGKLLHDLNRVCNLIEPEDPTTWAAAQPILAGLLASHNGSTAPEMSAVGHAHLDTAWLWPIEETRRKAQRTFSTAVGLMDRYPQFKFTVSQAYQYAAIEAADPDLFTRLSAKVAAGQWLPIGGSWVEPDCNLPWGESLCRQFLYGQAYFGRHFGVRSTIFWNPDVFGYDGQLPQLMREAGMTRFLTQKLSWNRFTSPPHHSFRWRGIDGSEVLTHFPPADNYNGECSIEEIRYHGANYKDADRTPEALYLFGFGDGGGGANPEMIEALTRLGDLQGTPRTQIRTPEAFFDRLAAAKDDLAVIQGELYFEYHRGVYTSQAKTKQLNRLCETRLQALEMLAAAATLAGLPAPSPAQIEGLWRVVLVNQFHDILPGSSITEVYQRTERELGEVADGAQALADSLLAALSTGEGPPLPVNTLGHPRAELVQTPAGPLAYLTAAPFSAGTLGACPDTVSLKEIGGGGGVLENARLSAQLTPDGLVRSLVHRASGREALAAPANRILLLDDRPTNYEAWDIDPFAWETAQDALAAEGTTILSRGPLRASVRFERALGRHSRLTQTVSLDAGSGFLRFETHLDWKDRRTLVKALFPLAVTANRATYETMFGIAERPTHANTDADAAMYEVPGQRWADLSEPGFGISLLSDARHGFSCLGGDLALTLIRGSQSPDPGADLGEHRFAYALYPHAGDWRDANTVGEAARFARPVLWSQGAAASVLQKPIVWANPANIVIDTIKPAEDGQGWIVRLYESAGRRGPATLTFGVPVREAALSNTLEERGPALTLENSACTLDVRPFQIATLRLS